MSEQQNEYFTDQLVRFPYYGPQGRTVTSNGMTITFDSHESAAATGPAAIRQLMDEVLTTMLDVAADPSHLDEYAADVRQRLNKLLGER